MLLGRGCISPHDLPTPAQGRFFCYLCLPSVQEAGVPRGAECFCLLMAYLKGPERKKKPEVHIWQVPSHPSNWQVFLDEREEPTHSSRGHHSLGYGASGRRPLGPEGLPKQQALFVWQNQTREGSRMLQPPLWFLRGAQPDATVKPTQLSRATQKISAWF